MSKSISSVQCTVYRARARSTPQVISFDTGKDLTVTPVGTVGPRRISPIAADLLDFAAAVFQIERQIRGQQVINPPEKIELRMRLRRPRSWGGEATAAAGWILHLLGNAVWSFKFEGGLKQPVPEHENEEDRGVEQVLLLSGGMDSACGAAVEAHGAVRTKPVSFYTRQKSLQSGIATDLGYTSHSQWRIDWNGKAGPGHSFYYRSFLFLSLAAVVAESCGARTILQYENGVLATAIPPSPVWMMTKHTHPLLHKYAAELFSALFGGEWEIRNPFLPLTKRGCVQTATAAVGEEKITEILKRTETCWYHWSNRIRGGKKKPGVPCGTCVPCVVRRTALPDEAYANDLLKDSVRNHKVKGATFRSYYGFLSRVIEAGNSPEKFYTALPPAGKTTLISGSGISLNGLQKLFSTFAQEFMQTYRLK